MSPEQIKAKEVELQQRERNIEVAEKNHETMKKLYEENQHLTDTQTIKVVAEKFVKSIKEQGAHFCLHDEDWGKIKTSIDNLKTSIENKTLQDTKILDELIRSKNDHESRITVIETQKTTTVAVVAAIFSAVMAVLMFIVAVWQIIEAKKEIKDMRNHADNQMLIEKVASYNGIEGGSNVLHEK